MRELAKGMGSWRPIKHTNMHRVASTLVHSIRRLGGMHSIELARARTKSIKRVLLARVLTQSCPANTNNDINARNT